jgi:hypothetical protein
LAGTNQSTPHNLRHNKVEHKQEGSGVNARLVLESDLNWRSGLTLLFVSALSTTAPLMAMQATM